VKVNRINVYMSVTLIFSDIIAFASCQDSISLSEPWLGVARLHVKTKGVSL